jgi:hypothetical protein
MANTVTLLSYANTFGEWMITTNGLVRENNDFGYNNYFKPTGTLYLNDPNLGLQVANNVIIAGGLQVQGVGSSGYIQNNLNVGGNTYSKSVYVDNTLTVNGNFIITGTTVYNTNKFSINSGSAVGANSYYIVYRGSSGANAEIRWNETSQYWDILDVNNGSNYSQILTANLVSDSTTSTSSTTLASSKSVNDAFSKASGAVQKAFTTISANGTSFTSAANTGTFTITGATSNGINILNSATNTIDLGLRTTGVVAGQYGSTSAIPTITVDTFGRVTGVSTNTVSGTAATSGYSPNAIIFANTTGYLSNTSSLQYTAANNTLIVANVAVSGTISNAKLQSYSETVNTVSSIASANYTIDLSRANIYDITMGANVTFTFSNPPTSGTLKNCTIILRQGTGGNKFATFTGAKYTDGAAPVLSKGASQIDVLSFFTIDGGTSYFGSYSMANVS